MLEKLYSNEALALTNSVDARTCDFTNIAETDTLAQ